MKHKVIGLFAVYALYSALGLFGIYLRAGESTTSPPQAPLNAPTVVAAPVQPGPTGRFADFGKGGGLSQNFGGIGGFGGIRPVDPIAKKLTGIEDGPTQVLATTTATPTPPAKTEFVNPKVEPGKVKWHPDFDAACKAAAQSGKPVLLFQMMGKLDDQFC